MLHRSFYDHYDQRTAVFATLLHFLFFSVPSSQTQNEWSNEKEMPDMLRDAAT